MKGHNPAAKNESLVRISERFQVGAADFTPRGAAASAQPLNASCLKDANRFARFQQQRQVARQRTDGESHHPTIPRSLCISNEPQSAFSLLRPLVAKKNK